MKNYEGEKFLNRLYQDLHLNDEVMHTANNSDTKEEKVKKYLDRLELVEELAKRSNHNGIELLKKLYYDKYVIKEEDVPESYFIHQQKLALDRGYGHIQIDKSTKIDTLITDQKKSLDNWLEYLISDDHIYPEWFKYYVFQGMIKLGSYDKETGSFKRRTENTVSMFVDLNREALALLYDSLSKGLEGIEIDDEKLKILINGGSFSKIYGYLLRKLEKEKQEINGNEGIWIKYDRGSNPEILVKTLEGKGTGWCTAGIKTARNQLENGDFHVYYTKDNEGRYKQPRIAIRMQGSSIGEIRGINNNQNIESEMEEILEEKLKEFPDRDKYKKKVSDMKILTRIYEEYKQRDLTIEEMRFLYEIDSWIEGFGYEEDPRIEEILDNRSFKKDLSYLFNCTEEEISDNKQDVLDGKTIKCFYGNLDLCNVTSAKGLVLPETIRGVLDLRSLTSTEGLKLPETMAGSLYLNGLINAEGLKLPETMVGSLYLNSLINAEGLKLPETMVGSLYLSSLTSAEGLKLPETISGDLNLGSLTSAKGVTLPKIIDGFLDLRSLTSAEGLKLPETISGALNLGSLISAKRLTLPETISGALNLGNLTSAKDLTLPKTIGWNLDLRSLTNAEGLKLPETMIGSLILSSLTSAKGLILPKTIGANLYLNSLTSAEGLNLPKTIGWNLVLSKLMTLEGIIVPDNFMCGNIESSRFTLDDLLEYRDSHKDINSTKK